MIKSFVFMYHFIVPFFAIFSGMAINISLMFGRIGSVMGTNIIGFTLDNYCSTTFTVSATLMGACAALSFFIPKIRRIDGQKESK